jgi:hypothetical protein
MSPDAGREFARLVIENPRSTEADARFDEAIEAIARRASQAEDPAQAATLDAAVTLLAAAKATTAGMGECTMEEPYATLYLQGGAQGLRWCCTHDTQHCWPA